MYYRSDWPEIGLSTALTERCPVDDDQGWRQETKVAAGMLRWVATQSKFESNLYGLPMWNLRLEIEDADGDLLTAQLNSALLQKYVNDRVRQLLDTPPWRDAYVSSKLVKGEPLYDALLQVGFQEIEHRRLYTCKIRDLVARQSPFSESNIRFTSLAAIAPEQLSSYQEQILDICREAFDQKGHSRHFTDPALLERLPGIAYTLAVMELNFEHVAPHHFLVAADIGSEQVCGFSAVGKKPGLEEDTYTQLLSAVRNAYRGRGIYRGLTYLLSQTLPQEATLLNVTHVGNRAIQRAYQDSGRVCLADTVISRRVFHADG
jgi:hypothetical protein